MLLDGGLPQLGAMFSGGWVWLLFMVEIKGSQPGWTMGKKNLKLLGLWGKGGGIKGIWVIEASPWGKGNEKDHSLRS